MARAQTRIVPDRCAVALGVVLLVLALYGGVSTPALIERWGVSIAGIVALAAWLGAAGISVPLMRGVPSRGFGLVLAVVAIALRAAIATCFVHRNPAGDAQSYLALAAGPVRGEGFHIYEPYIGSTLHAFYPPAYPLVLAGWTAAFGASIGAIVALNTFIDAVAALLLGRLGTRLGSAGAGRAAAWLYMIWPSVLLSAPLAQKEGLCVVLVLWLASAWMRAIDEEASWRGAIEIGVATGLLALTQPGLTPLAPLFGLALMPLASLGRVIAIGARAMPVAMVAMLPWWLRNYALLDAFVPLTSAGQVSLWVGNNPDATGNWVPPPGALRGLPELEYARAAGALARGWIVDHPAEFVRLTATKFVRAMGLAEFGVERLSFETPPPPRALTALMIPVAQGAHLLLFGGSAFALGRRGRRVPDTLILLLVASALQIALFGVWFEFGERHREFVTPFLLLAIAMTSRPKAKSGMVPSNA